MTKDPYNLNRFKIAQDTDNAYDRALAEISAGRKESCWMWFVCPQLLGIGYSEMCKKYAIRTIQEASAYLADKLLQERLEAIIGASLACFKRDLTPCEVYGEIDAQKLQSCTTLFGAVSNDNEFCMLCDDVLQYGYNGMRCRRTLTILHYLTQRDELEGLSKRQKVNTTTKKGN